MFADPEFGLRVLYTPRYEKQKIPYINIKRGIIGSVNPMRGYENKVFSVLQEQPVSVRLLADAVNAEGANTAVVMYIRFFEAAFDRRLASLEEPLHRFLSIFDKSINRQDIADWISIRHDGAHGRGVKRNFGPYEIYKHLDNLRWAACLVLLRKKNWASDDCDTKAIKKITKDKKINIKFVDPAYAMQCGEIKDSNGRYLVFLIDEFTKFALPDHNNDFLFIDKGKKLIPLKEIRTEGRFYEPENQVVKSGLKFGVRALGDFWVKVSISKPTLKN